VTLSDATSGATICYTIDGSIPAAATAGTCSAGTTYTVPFSINNATLRALGTKSGLINSPLLTSIYGLGGTCTLSNQNGCPTPDANNPTLASYLSQLNSELNVTNATLPPLTRQTATNLTFAAAGHIMPAGSSYVNLQPTCDPAGTGCVYNKASVFIAYIDDLRKNGVKQFDVNNPLQMMSAAVEYTPGV